MNYLAHLYLAGPEDDALIGNFLGDFVKGHVDEAPPAYREGIALHRAVDSFTDDHPIALQSRRRVSAERRRFAGIIVDVCFDHFLARDWPRFSSQPLPAFSRRVYALLESRRPDLPDRVLRALPHMQREDWLAGYARTEGIARALDGLSRRRPRLAPLRGSVEELLANYAGLESDFHAFFPQVEAFVCAHGGGGDGRTAGGVD